MSTPLLPIPGCRGTCQIDVSPNGDGTSVITFHLEETCTRHWRAAMNMLSNTQTRRDRELLEADADAAILAATWTIRFDDGVAAAEPGPRDDLALIGVKLGAVVSTKVERP